MFEPGGLNRLPGALLLGSDFKALGVARSLARRGIPIALVDDLPRSLGRAHVGDDRGGALAVVRAGLGQTTWVTVRGHHSRAGLDERGDRGPAHAASGTGHDRDLPFEIEPRAPAHAGSDTT